MKKLKVKYICHYTGNKEDYGSFGLEDMPSRDAAATAIHRILLAYSHELDQGEFRPILKFSEALRKNDVEMDYYMDMVEKMRDVKLPRGSLSLRVEHL